VKNTTINLWLNDGVHLQCSFSITNKHHHLAIYLYLCLWLNLPNHIHNTYFCYNVQYMCCANMRSQIHLQNTTLWNIYFLIYVFLPHEFIIKLYLKRINPLTPNDPYRGRTAPLTSKRYILYIYSTNISTEYFKNGIYSPFFPFQNAVCFIILTDLVPDLFTFYIQGVLKLKKKNSVAKRLKYMVR
jgi:hypothetical protein